jgi:hypothetical protein
MKLKLDENKNAVLQDGKPVYVHDDGKEIAFDAPAAMKKISDLNEEQATRRHDNKALQDELDKYKIGEEDGKPIFLNPEDATKAIETVKNLNDKELMDSEGVERLKAEMRSAFQEKEDELKKGYTKALKEIQGVVDTKEGTIYNLLVKTKFAQSPTILNKTILPSDMAATYFGKHFKVEGEGSKAKVFGYLDGEKILSRERPGEPANFEEALNTIIDHYPMKEKILKASAGGSGSAGNTGGDGGKSKDDKELFAKLPPTERLKRVHKANPDGGAK